MAETNDTPILDDSAPAWLDEVPRIEARQHLVGGIDGNLNAAPRILAKRTRWLKNQLTLAVQSVNSDISGEAVARAQAIASLQGMIEALQEQVDALGGAPGGGGGTVRDWDLTKVDSPATLSFFTGLPTAGVPYSNEGVLSGTNLSLSLAAGAPHVGIGQLATLPATGKVFWYWKPGAPTGSFAFAQNGITIGDLATPIAQVVIAAGAGLGVTVGGGSVTPVDGAFVDADVACIYADIDTGSIGAVTANGDFADIASGLSLGGQVVYAGLFGYVIGGTGMMSNDTAVTDLGSGLTPPVGYSALSGLADALLPAGSAAGDVLNVTVAGTWNGIPYSVNDGAIVAALSPAEVIPTGSTAAAVLAALSNKVSKPIFTGFLAEVGTGKAYATLAELQAFITANSLSGPMLVIDLYPGANDAMPVVDFWFPTFKEITIKAGGSTSGSFDFGASSLIVSGSAANTYYFNTLTLTTTSYLDAKYAVFYGTTTCSGLKLRHCYASGAHFTNTSGQADIGDFDLIPFGSTLVIDNTAPTSVLLSGKSDFLTLTSNSRLICQNGSSSGVSFLYTGATLATYGAAEVDAGGNFRFAQVDCGTADVPYAVGVKHGGIASIDPSGGNITGSGSILANFSQPENWPTAFGLIMA